MTDTEGVIRYRLDHRPGPLPAGVELDGLLRWFGRCREQGLIGRDPARYDGLAYGNISVRAARGFVISGTQTGGRPALGPHDLAWVEDLDAAANRLRASGPARPSSEAMTHGQVYRALASVNAVIHVHSPLIWRRARALGLPVTAAAAAYGTPAMAAEVRRLLQRRDAADAGVLAMGGHQDGVLAYAPDMDAAGELLLATLARAQAAPA
jgi:ribulose-5-phosphate 4-epimerase/fuculose-1-phosphate aldolase